MNLKPEDWGSYKKYKQYTAVVQAWAQTKALEIQNSSESSSSGRGSGEGQGGGGGDGGTTSSSNLKPYSEPPSPKFYLSVFSAYIETIAASDVPIDQEILSLLKKNILLRKLVSVGFLKDTSPEAKENNRKHQYAIGVFENALESLLEGVRRRAKDEGKEIPVVLILWHGYSSDEEDMLEDLFAEDEFIYRLSLEGEVEDPWVFALEEYQLTDDAFLPLDPMDEAFEALMAFLFDVDQIRRYCRCVWDSVVPSGTTSHISASFVTNRALQLVKVTEAALYIDFPVLKDLSQSFASVFQFIFEHVGKDTMDPILPKKFLDSTMYETFKNLVAFVEMRKEYATAVLLEYTTPGRVFLEDPIFGSFNPSEDRRAMSEKGRLLEDRFLMNTHWSDLALISLDPTFSANWIGKTGLAQEFELFVKGDLTVSWGLIFACQMQADTIQARRPYLESDVQLLHDTGIKMVREHDQFLASHFKYGTKQMEAVGSSREAIYNWTQTDNSHLRVARLRAGYRAHAPERDALWYYNPWLTANAISESVLNTFFVSLEVLAKSSYVYSAIHLWNMLQKRDYVPPPLVPAQLTSPNASLRLFDHLVDLFGPTLFSGPPPTSSFFRPWAVMMGINVDEFVSDIGKQAKRQKERSRRIRIEAAESQAWALHKAEYDPANMEDWVLSSSESVAATASVADPFETREDSAHRRRRHPLLETFEIVNSELGIASPPFSPWRSVSLSSPRGPLITLDLFKIHTLALHLFAELEPVLRPEIEARVTGGTPIEDGEKSWLWLTGYIMMSEELEGNEGRVDKVLLAKTREVVMDMLGDKRVGEFLIC